MFRYNILFIQNRFKHRLNQKGFSFIGLMLVLLIIAIMDYRHRQCQIYVKELEEQINIDEVNFEASSLEVTN